MRAGKLAEMAPLKTQWLMIGVHAVLAARHPIGRSQPTRPKAPKHGFFLPAETSNGTASTSWQ
jgi:hypothetical protein